MQLYGKDHVVIRQLLPKSGSFSTDVSARTDTHQTNSAGGTRGLEFRRLEADEHAEENDGLRQEEREQWTQDRIEMQVRQRTQQVQQYAAEQQKRLAEVELPEAVPDLQEVIYTLGNWTTLLEPELRTRAAAAIERMRGVLNDPGVRVVL